jgi:hypothetical protein
MSQDPGQRRNLVEQEPEVAALLEQKLVTRLKEAAATASKLGRGTPEELSKEDRRKLHELGYGH